MLCIVRRLAAIGLVSLLAACTGVQDNVFVLLEEPDGTVGAVEISNEKGSETIAKAGESVGMDAVGRAPSKPRVLETEVILKIFDEHEVGIFLDDLDPFYLRNRCP